MYKGGAKFIASKAESLDANKLWKHYSVTLGLILFFLISSFAVSEYTASITDHDASKINETGRQRMLSQRILYFSELLSKHSSEKSRKALKETIDAFANAHTKLKNDPNLSDELKTIYFNEEEGLPLDALVQNYIREANIVLSGKGDIHDSHMSMEIIGPSMLLDRLNDALAQYQLEANERKDTIKLVNRLYFLMAMTVILMEVIFIFLPAYFAIHKSMSDLEKQAEILDKLKEEARHNSLHDTLTGLANRHFIDREIARLSTVASYQDSEMAIFHIDLDRFKQINDTLGHAAGDYILKHVAKALKSLAQPHDIVGRIGGDEFVIITNVFSGREQLEVFASKIIEELAKPVKYHDQVCSFGASVGIESARLKQLASKNNARQFLENADIALFKAKEKGNGGCEFFSDRLRKDLEINKKLSDDILSGMTNNEFYIVYQPQIDAPSGKLIGVEALVRWEHPDKGTIGPVGFLPIAERLGILGHIDDLVFKQAVNDLSRWKSLGVNIPHLSVNVSAKRLADPDFTTMLGRFEKPDAHISFEILESFFADNIDDNIRYTLDAISDAGIDIEIDDFGTGHSSLVSMLALSPKRLKLARELVSPLPQSEVHKGIIKSVIEIANNLNIDILAEGAENQEQIHMLMSLGCKTIQGYYYDKPLTFDEITQRMQTTDAWPKLGNVA